MSKERFFAIVPVHQKLIVVEHESEQGLREGVEEALVLPKKYYPIHNFENDIIMIKGKKKPWRK